MKSVLYANDDSPAIIFVPSHATPTASVTGLTVIARHVIDT
jgi:hypothetical protein